MTEKKQKPSRKEYKNIALDELDEVELLEESMVKKGDKEHFDAWEALTHFFKLLPCEQYTITGSFALWLMGLWHTRIKDLDVVLWNPTDECVGILERLNEVEAHPAYPDTPVDRYMVTYNGVKVDFFVRQGTPQKYINWEGGWKISYPLDIVKAKRMYGSFKHWMQLKAIGEKFFRDKEFRQFITNETDKYI